MSDVQWWLVSLDQYGNPTLIDGAHAERRGADQAAYLHGRLGFAKGKSFAVARIELSDATPDATGANEDALNELNALGLKA